MTDSALQIVFMGSGAFGLDCLEAVRTSRHRLVHIFTAPARPAGRGRKQKTTPVAQWADAHNVVATETSDVTQPEVYETIKTARPDVLLVIAFGRKIPESLIELPQKAAINVHASLLPKYRGAAPINWAIINGETETGVSIITLAEKMDAGQILAQKSAPVGPDETAGALHDKLARLAGPLFVETLDKIAAGTAQYIPQDSARVTHAPKLKKTDGYIDWSQSAAQIKNLIRGVWPWPGAQTDYLSQQTGKTERVTIAGAQLAAKSKSTAYAEPGTVDEQLNVTCADAALTIKKIKPAGKALMDFPAFARGRHTKPPDKFLTIRE